MSNKKLLDFFKRCSFTNDELERFADVVATKVEVSQEHRIIKAHAEFKKYVSFSHITLLEEKVNSKRLMIE